jgi:transposase-like protein/Zn ribbon nucleic-acid-binding protein
MEHREADYPEKFEDFLEWFGTEKDCIDYIAKIRWADGFKCPKCGAVNAWITEKGLMHCVECEHQTSVTAGTVFQGTRKSLKLWFHVMWWMVSQKTGCSALNLKNAMDFDSYETAWTWLHKLRKTMVRPNREMLAGNIEVDETYLGAEETGVKGRETDKKVLVVVAVEEIDGRLGRVRFRCVKNASSDELIPFIQDNIEINSNVITDGWSSYKSLASKGYNHTVYTISKSGMSADELLPNVHLVISLVKRWLLGTHQGAVSEKHLQAYLDEFSFRFNRRLSTHRGKLFYRLMQLAVTFKACTMDEITGKVSFGDF